MEHTQPKSALPLKAMKQPNYKIIGIFILLVGIIGVNYILFNHPTKHGVENQNDHYEIPTETLVTEDNAQKPVHSSDKLLNTNNDLQEKLAEAKAAEFIARLQAPQSSENANLNHQANSAESSPSQGSADSPVKIADPNTAFLMQASNTTAEHVYATHTGPLPYLVGQGRFIFGSLAVAINSDLPGQITAAVSQDVYGEQGRKVLIPRGSLLIGEYKSGLVNHQARLFVVWTRLREPNGIDMSLGSSGTDALGRAGLTGVVDNHYLARFGSASLIALIGAGASTYGVKTSDQYNSLAQYRSDLTAALSEQADNTLSQDINIPPTINIPQGTRIVVSVNRDLDFSKVYA